MLTQLGRIVVVVMAVLLVYGGFYRVGPVPALGPLLDPMRGIWSVAIGTELPDSAVVTMPGASAPIRIVYDHRRVPHIFASNVLDATRALGYVVARDRLFQLDVQTRATAGRLAELVGRLALGSDRSQRRLGLARAAERQFAALSPDEVALLDAYAEGVNQWISSLRPQDLPVEYHLLGAEPQEWLPQHTMYLLKQMGLTLSYSTLDLRKDQLTRQLGAVLANALLPVHSPIQEPIQPSGLTSPRWDSLNLPAPPTQIAGLGDAEVFATFLYNGVPDPDAVLGSNNWAVGPIKSRSGHSILAGDPHLDLTLPSIWYEAHLVVPDTLDIYGATIPGAPNIVMGFNRDLAWSFTNTGADVTDFYREEVDDLDQPTRYRLDDEWQPIEQRVERFRNQRGRVIAVDTVRYTHRGPMRRFNDVFVSMRWTLLEESGEIRAFRDIARARTVDEWLVAFEPFVAPIQNGLVADRQGSIAMRATGQYPIRPGEGRGDRIFDGRTTQSDWLGYVPVTRQPFAIDPSQGFLASANQEPVDPRAQTSYLGSGWPTPWRAMRINKLLRDSALVDAESMRRFQTDPGSAYIEAFLPLLLAAGRQAIDAGEGDSLVTRAIALLGEWNGRYSPENERSLLFETIMASVVDATWDELMASGQRLITPSSAILAALSTTPNSEWWDLRATPAVEGRDDILVQSLRQGLERTVSRFGEPGNAWRWGNHRQVRIPHLLQLRPFASEMVSVQGGGTTLNPSNGSYGASWRMVVELGDDVTARTTYPGGQSGNPFSQWYDNRIAEWTVGELDPVVLPTQPRDILRPAGVVIIGPGE